MGCKQFAIGIGIFLILTLSIIVFAAVSNQRSEVKGGPEFISKWVALGASSIILFSLIILSSFAVTEQYFPEQMQK
jgi:hypothetical protein